jgi:predicted transcriptional regulator
MPQRNNVQKPFNKPQIQFALQALKQDANLSQRHAAAIYNIPQSTLSNQLAGAQPQCNYKPKSMKLLPTEEETVVQHIFDLDA